MSIYEDALQATAAGQMIYCKFLSANDTGENGSHQSGIYIAKNAFPILFERPGIRGANKDRRARIKWQGSRLTNSRFIYYGVGTRNEYRITNFGRDFPWLRPYYTGSLFILVKIDSNNYEAFILDTDDEIEMYMDAVGIGPAETNALLRDLPPDPSIIEREAIDSFVSAHRAFPSTSVLAAAARHVWELAHDHAEEAIYQPDSMLLHWIETEYRLFRHLETALYLPIMQNGFENMDRFVELANTVLNRRKSRAGASFEWQLSALFTANGLSFSAQPTTERKNRPDFIFPSSEAYLDPSFPAERLIMLAAKTTCKDRWRQILPEAGRLDGSIKYLCTLQQGISRAQLDEMERMRVKLVVPEEYISAFPSDRRDRIWTLRNFIDFARSLYG